MRFLLLAFAAVLPTAALAHTGAGDTSGFSHGFLHPLGGADHLLAMVAVGLFAAHLRGRALWLVPGAFVVMMAAGGALGAAGVGVPHVETGIALSVMVLGAAIAGGLSVPTAVAMTLAGFFAIFHGHAHGAELPPGSDAVAYSVGFVVATGMLHVCGILCGLAHRSRLGARALRLAGTMIASGGCYFLVAHFAGA